MERKVLVDGNWINLSDWKEVRKPDVTVPCVVNTADDTDGMTMQHMHEMTFQELRSFARKMGIKWRRTDKRATILIKIKQFYEKDV